MMLPVLTTPTTSSNEEESLSFSNKTLEDEAHQDSSQQPSFISSTVSSTTASSIESLHDNIGSNIDPKLMMSVQSTFCQMQLWTMRCIYTIFDDNPDVVLPWIAMRQETMFSTTESKKNGDDHHDDCCNGHWEMWIRPMVCDFTNIASSMMKNVNLTFTYKAPTLRNPMIMCRTYLQYIHYCTMVYQLSFKSWLPCCIYCPRHKSWPLPHILS
jgi:hypothetical protein